MLEKLEKIKERYLEVTRLLSDPAVISNQERNKELGKEFRELSEIVKGYEEYRKLLTGVRGSKEILEQGGDVELKSLAELELAELQPKLLAVEDRLKQLLVPKDPNDSKDTIIEIRGGTGGEEAALFASDLYRMYTRSPSAKDGKSKRSTGMKRKREALKRSSSALKAKTPMG